MGKIVVYTGPMFSRKTALLVADYERSLIAERTTVAFKPRIDGRFGDDVIQSRNAGSIPKAIPISSIDEICEYDVQDYFIDEFQFLDGDIQIIQRMTGQGKNFYITGLDMTAEGKPFALMRDLLCIADQIEKRKAICVDCKEEATNSFFLGHKSDDILVGNKEYVPLCRACWCRRMKKKEEGII